MNTLSQFFENVIDNCKDFDKDGEEIEAWDEIPTNLKREMFTLSKQVKVSSWALEIVANECCGLLTKVAK